MAVNLKQLYILILATAAALVWTSTAPAQVYRPERARRSITTDQYELVIQKNSQIDLLAIGGQPLLDNAFPSVIFEGGEEVPLEIDYRYTNRYSVKSPIGKGNGFVYVSAECEWRIATYPADACLTFDLAFTNNTKEPLTIAGLSPLGIGNEGKGGVYLGTGKEDVWVLNPPSEANPFARIEHEADASPSHLGAWSPSTGRTLVTGFLTHRESLGQVTLRLSPAPIQGTYAVFSSVCIFDPPIVVEPGGRLNAETLYFSVGQQNPTTALEAFVRASQAVEPFPAKANLHGWLPQTTDVPISSLLDNIEAARERMIPTGWSNLNLGFHWSASSEGLVPITTAAHAANLKVSVQSKPTQTDTGLLVLDTSHLKSLGVDTVELISTTTKENKAIPTPHPINVLQAVEASTTDRPKIVYGRPIDSGQFPLMDWALDSRSYYLPAIGNPLLSPWSRELEQDTRHFSDDQFTTAYTLAAIQGKPLRPATPWTELSPQRQHILSRLLPAPANSGRPLDLFQEGPPRQWCLPIHTKAGDWMIAALFNWEQGAAVELNTPLTAFGLNNDNLYTVYDFWAGQYLGLIEKTLRVEVPPEGVRLLGLRRYEKRPMLVASSRHYTQGASDHTTLDWVHESRTLSGTYTSVPGEITKLTILVPEPYVTGQTTTSAELVEQKQTGTLLELSLRAPGGGEIQWKVNF